MGEKPKAMVWTDEACRAFLDEYEAERKNATATGHEYSQFMEERAGTFPQEVIDFMNQHQINYPLPAGELARLSHKEVPRLPGVEVAYINA